jgi:hypothetical protein
LKGDEHKIDYGKRNESYIDQTKWHREDGDEPMAPHRLDPYLTRRYWITGVGRDGGSRCHSPFPFGETGRSINGLTPFPAAREEDVRETTPFSFQ